jgi:hypothetical protein
MNINRWCIHSPVASHPQAALEAATRRNIASYIDIHLKGAYTEWFGISPELISVLDTIYNMAYSAAETEKLQTGPVTHMP